MASIYPQLRAALLASKQVPAANVDQLAQQYAQQAAQQAVQQAQVKIVNPTVAAAQTNTTPVVVTNAQAFQPQQPLNPLIPTAIAIGAALLS